MTAALSAGLLGVCDVCRFTRLLYFEASTQGLLAAFVAVVVVSIGIRVVRLLPTALGLG